MKVSECGNVDRIKCDLWEGQEDVFEGFPWGDGGWGSRRGLIGCSVRRTAVFVLVVAVVVVLAIFVGEAASGRGVAPVGLEGLEQNILPPLAVLPFLLGL